jgi:hypothetical protein
MSISMATFAASLWKIAIGVGGHLVLLAGFFIFSVAVTFSNWPWTRTEIHTSGSIRGLRIGDSKRVCFERAMTLQRSGEVLALGLVDEEPVQ